MAGELLDPRKLAENLKERVKQEFVNLIPEGQWDKFLNDTIDDFKKNELQKVITDQIKIMAIDMVKSHLSQNSMTVYEGNKQTMNDFIKEAVKEALPSMFTSMLQANLQQLLYNIQSNTRY